MYSYVSNYNPVNPLPDDKILDWSKFKQNCRQHVKMHLKLKISAIYTAE